MYCIDIAATQGPNYWSAKHPHLIIMRLNLHASGGYPLAITGEFAHRLKQLFSKLLYAGVKAGRDIFFDTEPDGVRMVGQIVVDIALALQTLAGMNCTFGSVLDSTEEGICTLVLEYQEAEAGIYAAKAALSIVRALGKAKPYDLPAAINALQNLAAKAHPGPTTASIIDEAKKRNIPVFQLENVPVIQFGQGIHQRRIRASTSSNTCSIAVDIAGNKEETKHLLEAAAVPVPRGKVVASEEELQAAVRVLGYPLVIKPLDGNQGKGATIGITSWPEATGALALASRISRHVIVEKYISGFDFRLLVVNYKLVAAAKRTPACVVGDGKSTVAQLIDQVNSDPRRGCGHDKVLTAITVDETSLALLREKNLTPESVIPQHEVIYLKRTANLSTGGTSEDVTDQVHPDNVRMAERIARIVGLDICGIDVMAPEITSPLAENGGAVLEVNAAPGFRMHLSPSQGMPRNVAAPVMDMLYPGNTPVRIPIVAVSATHTRLAAGKFMAHLAQKSGRQTGLTAREGVYVGGALLKEGDGTDHTGAAFVLKDPTVDFAILECSPESLLRCGLGFDQCDVGIITGISAGRLGMYGIHNPVQMADVQGVLLRTIPKQGYAILNADDDLVYNLHKTADCNVAYFSMTDTNHRIRRHCEKGGVAAIIENGCITICEGKWRTRIEPVTRIPALAKGKPADLLPSILPAVLAGFIQKFPLEAIRGALQTFVPLQEQIMAGSDTVELNELSVGLNQASTSETMERLLTKASR